jgi:hypothetical protein
VPNIARWLPTLHPPRLLKAAVCAMYIFCTAWHAASYLVAAISSCYCLLHCTLDILLGMPSKALLLTPPLACLSLCVTVPADILPGQGLYPDQLNQTWTAVNCNSSSYGVPNTTYGRAFRPCRCVTALTPHCCFSHEASCPCLFLLIAVALQ